ncbi:hypothetical protein NLI96_g11804 [Meripilus lineatus]|uniref:Uncharacterized protein n=1 Tax=Meripilus lineatus TaxID=2056292 RepID=A0AAD5UR89_9APHY|nr:hypothetical protein NLI96_g11804 [Physisporinus lineatus]
MQIFVDPSDSSSHSTPTPPAPWPELGTRKSRIKENVRETSKMAGSTLKQSSRAHKSSSSTSTSSGTRGAKMEIFRDPIPEDMPPPPAPSVKKHKAGTASASKSSISVFRDEEPSVGSSKSSETPQVPSTPKFTPYRDADVRTTSFLHAEFDWDAHLIIIIIFSFGQSGSPSSRNAAPGSVMKDKSTSSGVRGLQMSSEAEALRKDPLKNYGEEALLGVVDL